MDNLISFLFNVVIQIFLNFKGLGLTMLFKKVVEMGYFGKTQSYAMSDTFQALCFNRIFDSCKIRSDMICEVVFWVVSLTDLFR